MRYQLLFPLQVALWRGLLPLHILLLLILNHRRIRLGLEQAGQLGYGLGDGLW